MNRKGKQRLQVFPFTLMFAGLGGTTGYFLAPYIGNISFLGIIYTLIILGISFPLHILLHEFGHVLGRLISGYDFIMFRIFSTVWITTPAGLSKRKEYIPGVLGQALMVPPEIKNNEQPPLYFSIMSADY